MSHDAAQAAHAALPDEARLDAVLLHVLEQEPDSIADVFAERSLHASASGRIERDHITHPLPVLRAEAGVLARRFGREGLEARHGSELPGAPEPLEDRAVRSLIEDLAALSSHVEERAARLVLAEARVLRVDLEIEAHERAFRVVSSEWGHAAESTSWATLRLSVTTRGRLESRVSRSAGVGGLSRLREMAAPGGRLDLLFEEALATALARGDAASLQNSAPIFVLAPGAGGVLIHEAVGHALEGDIVERGASLFGGRMGERIAVPGLSVVDDPTLTGLAGSYAHDDEGAPASRRCLVEGGVLRGVLLDGLRSGFARRQGGGHGRRATFRDLPLPRMANTCVLPGAIDEREILAGVEEGVLVTRLARAAADPLTGDVHLRATESWRIERGRVTEPLLEFGLSGNAATLLHAIEAIGSDLAWDDGGGSCGREGQWVRVAVGTPTFRLAAGGLTLA